MNHTARRVLPKSKHDEQAWNTTFALTALQHRYVLLVMSRIMIHYVPAASVTDKLSIKVWVSLVTISGMSSVADFSDISCHTVS